jgi:hypothetical protein
MHMRQVATRGESPAIITDSGGQILRMHTVFLSSGIDGAEGTTTKDWIGRHIGSLVGGELALSNG